MRHLHASRLYGTRKALAATAFLVATTALTAPAGAQSLPQYAAHVSPITSTAAHAFNSSYYQRVPLNLATLKPYAYSESEYTLNGLANVYEYVTPSSTTNDSVQLIQSTPLSYVNRILVRAPSNPANFSGNVIVEIANDALVSDNQVAWPYANQLFTSNGDAYILLTSTPSGLATLKAYSATRYRALTWPLAASTRSCSGGSAGEGGIIYDQITQLGTLLKGNGSGSPLAGYTVKHLFLTGYSGAAETLLTYDRVFGLNSSLYDGYMVSSGGFRAPLNGCEASATGLNRKEPPASTVSAVFQTQTTSELVLAYLEEDSVPTGTDSNTSSDRYRLYEVAGAAHVNGDLLRFSPERSDFPTSYPYLTNVTQSQAQTECGQPSGSALSSFPNRYVYDAIWANLEHWVTSGTSYVPPSEASPFNVETYLLSGYTIEQGGYPSVAVESPVETYVPGTSINSSNSALVTFCALLGYQVSNGQTVNASTVKADAAALAAAGYMTSVDATALEANPNLEYEYPDGTTTVPDNPPAQ